MVADLDIRLAQSSEAEVLARLMQLYIHDFSEQWTGLERGELDEAGLFDAYPLDAYWRAPDHAPLLIRTGGRLAGFALVNAHSHCERPLDRAIAEFFIVRKHRRGGLGRAAALQIFRRYPGRWEVAVARRNTGALAFWRGVVAAAAQGGAVEELDLDTAEWNGQVLRFRVVGQPP